MKEHKWIKSKWLPVMAVILLMFSAMTFIHNAYLQHLLIVMLYNIMLAVSFRFITLMGQWTFAHVAVASIAAYISAMLSTNMGYPVWASWIIGVIAVTIFSTILGLLTMRVKNVFYFFITWAVAVALENVWRKFRVPFGGNEGIVGIPPPGTIFHSEVAFYYLALVLTLLFLGIFYRLEKSRFGRTLEAINQNEQLSTSLGIQVFKYRVIAFVIGSTFAGIAGGLFAHYNGTITPSDFGWVPNWFIVIYLCVGGYRSMLGPILGTVLVLPIMQYFAGYKELTMLIVGVFVILMMVFFRLGIEGMIYKWRHPEAPSPIIP